MEYLFGTTRDGYTDLYSDSVAKSRGIGKYFQSDITQYIGNYEKLYGYIPTGTNNMVPMFFKYDQYNFHGGRKSYYIHAVALGEDAEYYKSEDFFEGFFYRFVDDVEIQDISLNGWGNGFPKRKVLADSIVYQKPPENALKQIVYNLIKKKPLVIVMDNDSYDAEAYRMLMHDIFEYLPYSLRRWCSFATATPNNQYFKIGIIPERIRSSASNCIRIHDAVNFQIFGDAETVAVDYLFSLTSAQRKQYFDDYEVIFGEDEFYQTQNFIDFINAFRSGGKYYDVLLHAFIQRKNSNANMLPESIRAARAPYYMDENNLDAIFQFDTLDPLAFIREPMDFWDKHVDEIIFTYMLNPNANTYFEESIAGFAYITVDECIYNEFKNELLYEDVDDHYEQNMVELFNDFSRKFHHRILAWKNAYEIIQQKFIRTYDKDMNDWWIRYQSTTSYTKSPETVEARALTESKMCANRFIPIYAFDRNNDFDFHCIERYIEECSRKKCAEIREKYAQQLASHTREKTRLAETKAERTEEDEMARFLPYLESFDQFIRGEKNDLNWDALIETCPKQGNFILEKCFAEYLIKERFDKINEKNKSDILANDIVYQKFCTQVPNFNWKHLGKRLESESPYLSIYMSINGYDKIDEFVNYLIQTKLFEKINNKELEILIRLVKKKISSFFDSAVSEDPTQDPLFDAKQASRNLKARLNRGKMGKNQKRLLVSVNNIFNDKISGTKSVNAKKTNHERKPRSKKSGSGGMLALIIGLVACLLIIGAVVVLVVLNPFGGGNADDTATNESGVTLKTLSPTDTSAASITSLSTMVSSTETTSAETQHSHDWGAWSKFDDFSHRRTCSCLQEETDTHKSDEDGIIIKEPTHKEKGKVRFTCLLCKTTYEKEIPKIDDCEFEDGKCTVSGCDKTNTTTESMTTGEVVE